MMPTKLWARILRDGGAQFTTYAPNAVNVELMINGSLYDMQRDRLGIWSAFREGVKQGDIYQYVITTKTLEKHYRSDPFAFYSEVRPKNASILYDMDSYQLERWRLARLQETKTTKSR